MTKMRPVSDTCPASISRPTLATGLKKTWDWWAYFIFETLKLYPAAPPIGVSGWRGERAGGFSQPVDS